MSDFETFPDAEALVATELRDAAISAGGVFSSIPKAPTFPLITVKRIGGLPLERHAFDRARIQIDVWGTTKSEAFDIATAARLVCHRMETQAFTGAFVAGVVDDLGLTWQPDPLTSRDRYIFGVAVILRFAA